MRWIGIVPALVLTWGLLTLGAVPASAAPPAWLSLGEAWEVPIYEGIQEQDRERKRMAPSALVGKYQRLAARRAAQPERVRRYYLHARALGLHYATLMAAVDAASGEAQKKQLLRDAGRSYDGAMRAYRDALSLAPRCYFCYHDMAILELQRVPPDENRAIEHLKQAASINPRYPEPLRKHVLVLTSKRRWREAIPVLHQLIELEPQDVLARVSLAGSYAETGRLDTAYSIAKQLIDHDPKNPVFRGLMAQLDLRGGSVDAAQETYRKLAEEMPTNKTWLQGFMACLKWREENKKPTRPEDIVWVLNGLLRLERDPARRAQLREQLRDIKEQIAKGAGMGDPNKPPSIEQVVGMLKGPDEEARYRMISFLNAVNEMPPEPLLKGVMSRLAESAEPSARVRALAVEIVGKHLGFGFIPYLRLVGTQDSDAVVRLAVVDAITRMADMTPTARSASILNLDPMVADSARSVASAARLALLTLGHGRLPEESLGDDAAHRKAFSVWWSGAQGEDLKIRSITAYPRIKDRFVEDVLLRYLADESFFVRQAAFDALVTVVRLLGTPDGAAWYKERKGYAAFRTWLLAIPRPSGTRLTEENEASIKPRLQAWVAGRPS